MARSLVAEGLGTAYLLIAIVGSGILGERLAAGNVALALLANALSTGAALYALIVWLAPLSGAHFNPLVSLVLAFRGDIAPRVAVFYMPAQLVGAVAGVAIADAMFDMPPYSLSSHLRSGPSQWLSEFLVTFGLIGMVWTCSRMRPSALAGAVAAYIGAGFWFTATDFANPAVALARAFTDTFSGIRPIDVPGFLVAETLGALAAVVLFRWLVPNLR
ncbi:aquaporin [Bradyrhizobium liaoningense]|uniref:aquaporin n=1 Tax=Bradyrhizobium liaoningense TaxID=43992 RepID=UPI001BAD93CF|nr:aquaporin [Bradyrhizobium liaoningense]MBR0982912.1 aquaporin [Bradyrhizobium liaoningense]